MCYVGQVKSSQVKSSTIVGLRDRVAIIRALLHAIPSPHPHPGYGDLSGVGRRRTLSEVKSSQVVGLRDRVAIIRTLN